MEIEIRNGATFGISAIPGRKRQALYLMHGNRIDPVAYFADDEDAEAFKSILRDLCEKANRCGAE